MHEDAEEGLITATTCEFHFETPSTLDVGYLKEFEVLDAGLCLVRQFTNSYLMAATP